MTPQNQAAPQLLSYLRDLSMTARLASIALAAAMTTAVGVAASDAAAQGANEKCYGVAKAGKNDCQTPTSSCAGTSKVDGQKDAWLYAPAGLCAKLAGGSLTSSK